MSEELWLQCHQYLLNGDYDAWWPRHEWIRTGSPDTKDEYQPTPTFGKPIWDGFIEPCTLLVNADFGMGDTIHYYRFIAEAQRRVTKLILRCDGDFKTLFTDVDVVDKNDPLPSFDKIIHMMALPYVLCVVKALINGKPYLKPNHLYPFDYYIGTSLVNSRSSKIGVCWKGNPYNPRDSLRSVPDTIRKRFVWNFDAAIYFFNVNRLTESDDRFIDFSRCLTDWNQTAHFLQMLDLVITVDTAVAHLAGALGIPVWLLLNNEDVDWRWGKEGDRTIWYESMRIFRRTSTWEELIDRVTEMVINPMPSFEW